MGSSELNALAATKNPNLKTIAETKKSGPKFFICVQYPAAEKIAPQTHARRNFGGRRIAGPQDDRPRTTKKKTRFRPAAAGLRRNKRRTCER